LVSQFLFLIYPRYGRYRCVSKSHLRRRSGIALNFSQTTVSGHGGNLGGTAPGLSQAARGGFAQPMRGTVRQAGFIAPITKPIAYPGGRERLAEFGDQERKLCPRCPLEDGGQLRMDRNGEIRAGLALAEMDPAIEDMLPAEPDYIAASLAGIEQQGEGAAGRRRAERASQSDAGSRTPQFHFRSMYGIHRFCA
jgi:hypothetical protein